MTEEKLIELFFELLQEGDQALESAKVIINTADDKPIKVIFMNLFTDYLNAVKEGKGNEQQVQDKLLAQYKAQMAVCYLQGFRHGFSNAPYLNTLLAPEEEEPEQKPE